MSEETIKINYEEVLEIIPLKNITSLKFSYPRNKHHVTRFDENIIHGVKEKKLERDSFRMIKKKSKIIRDPKGIKVVDFSSF